MFSTLKKLFGRQAAADVINTPATPQPVTAAPFARSNLQQRQVRVDTAPRAPLPSVNATGVMNIPVRSVLARLPNDLMQRLRQTDVGDAEIAVPIQRIVSQIGSGAVKITFGELRQASPPGTFSGETDRDRVMVEIPLNEILLRLDPALLPRRTAQKHVTVPADVTGPFGGQAHIMFTTQPLKAAAQSQAPAAQPAPQPRVYASAPAPAPMPVQPAPMPAQAPAPVAAAAPAAKPAPFNPFKTTKPVAPSQPQPPPQPEPQDEAVIIPFQPVRASQPAQPVQAAYPFQPSVALAQSAPQVRPAVAVPPQSKIVQFQQAVPPVAPPKVQPQPVVPPPLPQSNGGALPAEQEPDLDTAIFTPTTQLIQPAPIAYAPAPAPIAPPRQQQPAPSPIAPPRQQPAPFYQPVQPARPIYPPVAPMAPVAPMPEPEPEPEPEPVQSYQEPEPVAPPVVEMPVTPLAPAAPIISPIAPEPEPEPEPIRFSMPPEPVAPAPAAAEPAPAAPAAPATPNFQAAIAGETRFLTLAISEVAGGWPGPLQQEIMTHQLMTSSLALPFGVIEMAIKQGKVSLPWRILRSWIKPPVHITTSPNDAMMLELPLKALTPLFMAELKANKPQKKVAVDETIPNLFSNRMENAPAVPPVPGSVSSSAISSSVPLQPVTAKTAPGAATAAAKVADTNYFARPNGDHPEEAAPPVKKGPSPGTAFLQRYATPNEIVSKASALDGVDGALIALPDGLLVANSIPGNMNADTVAGFLPQIFNRVSQCTKELRMGELNNLNFTVGNVPWKIFKVGAIFFAAFGRPGEPLPTAQLAGIAAELDRKAK